MVKATVCGHMTSIANKIALGGKERDITLIKGRNGEVKYCHQCITKMAIQCSWCGEIILPSDKVSLVSVDANYVGGENDLILITEKGKCLAGCQYCAPPDYQFEAYLGLKGEINFL